MYKKDVYLYYRHLCFQFAIVWFFYLYNYTKVNKTLTLLYDVL